MLNRSASLAMSISVLKALRGKLDIKSHSLYYLIGNKYFNTFGCWFTVTKQNREGDLFTILGTD